jgi:hypothetical protein
MSILHTPLVERLARSRPALSIFFGRSEYGGGIQIVDASEVKVKFMVELLQRNVSSGASRISR